MTYRTIFFNVLMSIFFCVYSPTLIAFSNNGFMNQMPMDFEAELEEANRAIEEYVSSLSPEEQDAFNRSVEDMARMFENMSEDEFEQFLGEMFTDEQMMEPNPFEISQPQIQEVAEVTLSPDDKKKVETAVKIVNDIINSTNLFMVIVNSSPELPNRITRWGAKGDVPNWQAGADWTSLKIELDVFVQQLYKTLEQDLTTKKYKYLNDVIADEALYNNLIQLQTELNTLIPVINIPEFSVQKLNDQSKTAIKNILGKYTEGFYLLGIQKAVDAIFQKYAPEAEKIRAAEDAANKKALEAHKATRTPARESSAGMESDLGYDYGYGSGYGSDYGYNPYDSYGSYGGDYGYNPYDSYGSDYGSGSGNRYGGGDGGNYGSGGSRSGGNGGSGDDTNKDAKDKKTKDKGKFAPNYKIERAIADIKSGLQDITAALTPDETTGLATSLADLKTAINKDDIDVIFAGATLPMVDKKLTTIDDAIKTITEESLNARDLGHYQREINNAFTKNDKALKALRDDIDNFEKKTEEEKAEAIKAGTESTKIEISSLSPEKRWAYFGEETLPTSDENDKLKEQITAPVSLFTIKDKIDALLKNTGKFAGKQAPIAKPEPVEETAVNLEE